MEIVIETCLDSIKMLPFLFFAFLLIEFLEYYSGGMSGKLLKKVGKAGPVVGAVPVKVVLSFLREELDRPPVDAA